MADWEQRLAARFLVFDGPDGSGKSTQLTRFAEHCVEAGLTVCRVREPGGTAIGEQIRQVLLNPGNAEMSIRCEMMLYMASRAQLIEQTVAPALARGELVLADRFVSSTLAYQGTAGGLTREEILQVGRVAVGDRWPDLTVLFDVDEQTAARRMHGGRKGSSRPAAGQATLFADRMELKDEAFHRRVRQGFLAQAEAEPDRYLVIDAAPEPDAVYGTLLQKLQERIGS